MQHYFQATPGRTACVDGQEYLYFSGTAYLGIPAQPTFREYLLEGLNHYGSNYGGSRLSNPRFAVFEETEQQLAQLSGAAAALVVSSGTVAGQLVVRTLSHKHIFFYAPGTHPALFQEASYLPNCSYEAWTNNCIQEINSSTDVQPVILANSLDPLYAQSYNFDWLHQLNCPALLVLDDSHGIGILGQNGGGIFTTLNVPEHIEVLVVASLGKAFGIPAGAILGTKKRIEQLKNSPFFGGASPAVPAYLHAFLQAQDLYPSLRQQLQERIQQFAAFAESSGRFRFLSNYPVFYTEKNELANQLKEANILLSSFPYPTKDSPLITRVILNALHTEADVKTLISSIE